MKVRKLRIGSKNADWFYKAEVQWPETTAEKLKTFGEAWINRFVDRAASIVFRADILDEVQSLRKSNRPEAEIVARISELWATFDWPNREPTARGGSRIKTVTLNAKAGATIKLTPEFIQMLEAQGVKLNLK